MPKTKEKKKQTELGGMPEPRGIGLNCLTVLEINDTISARKEQRRKEFDIIDKGLRAQSRTSMVIEHPQTREKFTFRIKEGIDTVVVTKLKSEA